MSDKRLVREFLEYWQATHGKADKLDIKLWTIAYIVIALIVIGGFFV